ncbi:MAG: GIY-YIG nuclease family protein, partial [bacterium]
MTPGWWVYLLRCRGGSLYTGITNDLTRRLALHRAGKASKYTRARLPVRLVFRELAGGKSAALRREAALKRLQAARKPAHVRAKRMVFGSFAGLAV